jgi:multiple sugar transport system permease protein
MMTVPLGVFGSLLAAALLNQDLKATVAFRTFFFLPSLTPMVASAMLWRWVLHPDVGVLNFLLWKLFRIEGPAWLMSTQWALPSLMMIALWGSIGGSRMIIFLAGLQGVRRGRRLGSFPPRHSTHDITHGFVQHDHGHHR